MIKYLILQSIDPAKYLQKMYELLFTGNLQDALGSRKWANLGTFRKIWHNSLECFYV